MSQSDFEKWYHFCLLPENDGQQFHVTPGDPGGATAWGWTFATWRSFAPLSGRVDVSIAAFRQETADSLKPLTRVAFWNAIMADQMPSGVNAFWADFHFNSGNASRVLQGAIGAWPDGVVGKAETIPAIWKFQDRHDLLDRLLAARLAYYDRQGFRDRWPGVYRRARTCHALAMGMIDAKQVAA